MDIKIIKPNTNMGKVGVLMGGRSAEREISIRSGTSVLNALLAQGINANAFDPAIHSIKELADQEFTKIFIALHGRYGEDGTTQGVLEQLEIAYTGSGVLASSLAMNKVLTKQIWQANNLLTPRFCLLTKNSNFSQIISKLGLPLIVKPICEGSSLGVTKITNDQQMSSAYEKAASFNGGVIAEEFIDGTELTCAILEKNDQEDADNSIVALPIIKIIAPEGKYNYHNKYNSNDTLLLCPSQLDEQIEMQARNLSILAFKSLNCRGWGRADIIWRNKDKNQDGGLYLLEMNTVPGMTNHSLLPKAAAATGLSYADLVLTILSSARLDLHLNTNFRNCASNDLA